LLLKKGVAAKIHILSKLDVSLRAALLGMPAFTSTIYGK
jgi:hypothetical protein